VGTYIAKLTKREQIAEGTMAFYFDRPAGFEFVGGQSMDFTLIDPPQTDAEGNRRTFSLASAPGEPHLMIATRLRDTAFKRTLKSLPLGTEVSLEGPFGSMTLHRKTTRPAVMLAGGIGITPFRSMVVRAAHEKLPHHIFLFYANRRPEDAPFLEELQALERDNPNYKFVGTMTGMDKSRKSWNGESGRIDMEMIKRHAKEMASPIFYAAGPPAMVTGLQSMLNDAGVDDDDIRTEEFSGY